MQYTWGKLTSTVKATNQDDDGDVLAIMEQAKSNANKYNVKEHWLNVIFQKQWSSWSAGVKVYKISKWREIWIIKLAWSQML